MLNIFKKLFNKEDNTDLEVMVNELVVGEDAIRHFKECVKGYKGVSDEDVAKRIKRNFLVGVITKETDLYKRSEYHNLILHSHKENGKLNIYNIFNRKGKQRLLSVNEDLKKRLNKYLNIDC